MTFRRRLAPLPLLLLTTGCAFLAEAQCRSQGEAAGLYLGTRHTGESCSTSTRRSRDGRFVERITHCTPTYQAVYQWNANSERVFQSCMARLAPAPVAAQPLPQPPPPLAPVK